MPENYHEEGNFEWYSRTEQFQRINPISSLEQLNPADCFKLLQYSSLLIACIIHLLEKPPSCEHQLQKHHRLYCAKPIFRCDFDNKTFYAIQPPIKFHNMTKFILLSLQIYSVNICVMHFCDRSYKIIFLDGQLSSVITVTLQYLHRQLTV